MHQDCPYVKCLYTKQELADEQQTLIGNTRRLGIRMHHKFPWEPNSDTALGLALYEQHIQQGTSPSRTKDRIHVVQVQSCFSHLFSHDMLVHNAHHQPCTWQAYLACQATCLRLLYLLPRCNTDSMLCNSCVKTCLELPKKPEKSASCLLLRLELFHVHSGACRATSRHGQGEAGSVYNKFELCCIPAEHAISTCMSWLVHP